MTLLCWYFRSPWKKLLSW